MSSKELRRTFRALRTLFVVFVAIAGVMLCLTAMHFHPAEHSANAAPATATAMVGHHEVQSVHSGGLFGAAAACQGPCGQDHVMMASACVIALLLPILLLGAIGAIEEGRPFRRVLQYLVRRVGVFPPPMPPSLLVLSISRT